MRNSDDDRETVTEGYLQSMAELAYESLKEEYKPDWDPYLLYDQRLRSHVNENPHVFCEKFKKGYGVLIETLKSEENL
jgi:hypothetical protein